MKKIILVDDQIMFREGLANILNIQPDFKVIGQVGTAHEALELVQELHPDMVLMDFDLPDASGIEATQKICSEFPKTIVVFLTVFEDDQILFAALRSGAKGYLLKSHSSSQLLASLRAIERGEAAISRAMVKNIVDEFSRQGVVSRPDQSKLSKLTPRELEILKELTSGLTNLEIALHLSISETTVKNQVHNILSKLNLKNRHEAIWFARQQGLGNAQDQDLSTLFDPRRKRSKD